MVKYNELLSYEILDNGYEIYLEGKKWIVQLDEYSKVLLPNGTFEENCLKQLKELENSMNEQEIEG